MGPKSTGPFIDQVVSHFQFMTGAKHDIDFPPMMIYSLPTPFYVDRPIDHDLMEKTISGGLQKLEACGVSFIAMPCNTAHVYFDELQRRIGIPLLNIVSASLNKLSKSTQKISILGTRSTLDAQIYQRRLQAAGVKFVVHPSWQDKVDRLILSMKSMDPIEKAIDLWEDLASALREEGVDTIILACTDLQIIFQTVKPPFLIIDSSACLAEAVVQKWLEKNPKMAKK
jgi:aspartate racemase